MNEYRTLRDGSTVIRRLSAVSGNSAEWVLKRIREDNERNDPPLYSIQMLHGRPFMWLDLNGNVGWYAPELDSIGTLIGIRGQAQIQPYEDEPAESRRINNYQFNLISPKRRTKIEHLMSQFLKQSKS